MLRGKTLVLLFIGAVALGLGIWLGQLFTRQAAEPPLEISGIYFAEPKALGNFTLTDQNGQPFTRDNLKGKWSLLYLGYTYCPDVCPMTLTHLSTVAQRLAQQGSDQDTAYVFVSVDPRRDTPQRLGQYATYFNKAFQGATGTPEELDKLTKPLGIFYKLNDQDDKQNYTVDHSSAVVLINPAAALQAVFTHPDQPDTLLADFHKIRASYQVTH